MKRLPALTDLFVGHDAKCSAEATLVLAARAGFGGWFAWGKPMPRGVPRVPTLREVAAELGLSLDAVRRGDRELASRGEVFVDDAGDRRVCPVVLACRWNDRRRRCHLPTQVRTLGLRPRPHLMAGLVHGQVRKRGRVALGRQFLAERLGWACARRKAKPGERAVGYDASAVDRALASLRKAGVLHTWTWRGQLFLAVGPSRIDDQEASRIDDQERRPGAPASRIDDARVANRRRTRSESTTYASRIDDQTPDCPPEYPPERARAREDGSAERQSDPVEVLVEALLATPYRRAWRDRRAVVRARAPALHAEGLTPTVVAELEDFAVRQGERIPGALLTKWLDESSWRNVFLDVQHEAKQRELRRIDRPESEPMLAASVGSEVIPNRRSSSLHAGGAS